MILTNILGEQDNQSYKQLGNAVNVNIILEIQRKIDLFFSNSSEFPKSEILHIRLDDY